MSKSGMIYRMKTLFGAKSVRALLDIVMRYMQDLCLFYVPPESYRNKNENYFKKLEEVTSKINSEYIITIGDFNARTKNLDDVLRGEKDEDQYNINFSHKSKRKELIKIIP